MNLSKSDALFLHSLLFHALTKDLGGEDVVVKVQDIMNSIESYILDEQKSSADEEVLEHGTLQESDPSEDGFEDPDAEVSASSLESLKPMFVITPSGQKASLEFEAIGDGVDALVDGGSLIIDEVSHLRIHSDVIELYSGDEWHEFPFKKIPREWSSLLEKEKLYEVTAAEDAESDDEDEEE